MSDCIHKNSARNHEVLKEQPLLDERGNIAEPGWSRRQLQTYHRADVKASSFRMKEWDYYIILSQKFGVAFTISDNGYFGLQSASFLDFTTPDTHTNSVMNAFPMGKLHLPERSDKGDTVYHGNGLTLEFHVEDGKRRIICEYLKFDGDNSLSCDITLLEPKMDTMVIATPWKKEHHFYYNQKINCMRADGWVKYADQLYQFDPKTDFGSLDFGRGVWTYDNTWYWGSGNCDLNGKAFGFNIGYGFGDTSAATENVLFYDGNVHKLDDIIFHIPKEGYERPWRFTSSDHRFEMNFEPIIDRSAMMDFKLIMSDQHQVFGKMSGTAILDDGTEVKIHDMLCFAERVHNKY